MAQIANARTTFTDTVLREDILDRITDISPDENMLTTSLETATVEQRFHQWPEYYDARPSQNQKSQEGNDASLTEGGQPRMLGNWTQVIDFAFGATYTDLMVKKVSPQDGYAQEKMRFMKKLKNVHEFAVLRGTLASGSSGVAREMKGLRNWAQDNGRYTARLSGTSYSEQEFKDMMLENWSVTDAELANLLLVDGNTKSSISNFFTTAKPRIMPNDDKRFVMPIEAIESDFGNLVQVKAHKDMVSTAQAREALLFNKNLTKIGYLDTPSHQVLAVTGLSKRGQIWSESTTEVADGGRSMVLRKGYL